MVKKNVSWVEGTTFKNKTFDTTLKNYLKNIPKKQARPTKAFPPLTKFKPPKNWSLFDPAMSVLVWDHLDIQSDFK